MNAIIFIFVLSKTSRCTPPLPNVGKS